MQGRGGKGQGHLPDDGVLELRVSALHHLVVGVLPPLQRVQRLQQELEDGGEVLQGGTWRSSRELVCVPLCGME